MSAGVRRVALALLVALFGLACTSLRLARLDPLPMDESWRGPEGSYTLTPPSAKWIRTADLEGDRIDLALARKSNDAWLNVSVLPGRFATPELALAHARAQVDALMQTVSRDESDVTVPSPEGELPARLGVYCGTFDLELRSRDSCFVILTTLRGDVSYALVGQVRVKDAEPGRREELLGFVRSLRLVDPAAMATEGGGAEDG